MDTVHRFKFFIYTYKDTKTLNPSGEESWRTEKL